MGDRPLSVVSPLAINFVVAACGTGSQAASGSVGDRLAAHIIIKQCLPQSDTGASSGQHGMLSGIAISAWSAMPAIMA